MSTIYLSHPVIGQDIEDRILTMNRHLSQLVNSGPLVELGDAITRAQTLARRLDGDEGPQVGYNVARGLLDLLVPQVEQQQREFWEKPLGQALAWWTGGEGSTARRRMVAEAATGTSRQAVTKMINEGHLAVGPNGDVTAESLRAHLQRRHPQAIRNVEGTS